MKQSIALAETVCVCVTVCLSVQKLKTTDQKLMYKLVECRSDWILMIFDLDLDLD